MAAYNVKLFSERYLSAMSDAKRTLDSQQFRAAAQYVTTALDVEPRDADATALMAKINQSAAEWEKQQLEAKRVADEAKARQLAQEFAALPILNPEYIINSCWNTTAKPPDGSVNLGDVARQKGVMAPISVPIWAVTDLIVKGIGAIPGPSPKLPRFDQIAFNTKFQNAAYKYFGKIDHVDMASRRITFVSGGSGKHSFVVMATAASVAPTVAAKLVRGSPVWVSGQLTALEEDGRSNNLVLDNAVIYPMGNSDNKSESLNPSSLIETVESKTPQPEARVFPRRDIRNVLAGDAELGQFATDSRLFRYDLKEVWRAAVAEAKVGPLFDSIGAVNESEGWIYSKIRGDHGYVESDYYTQAHPQYMVWKQYVVLVSDTGDGIDVQVIMKVYTDRTWTDYQGIIRSDRKLDRAAYVTTGGASVFFDGVQSRLHHHR